MKPIKTIFPFQQSILKYAKELNLERIACDVIYNPKFYTWSGSSKPEQHHYGDNGLIVHTSEVINLCLSTIKAYPKHNINKHELFLSALFHDYGKMWDYEKDADGNWTGALHKRKIHHISRSAIEWNKIAKKFKIDEATTDNVTHNILAHHGLRDFGSPVSPYSVEAWILHLCDGLSARIDDAERLDIVMRKQK